MQSVSDRAETLEMAKERLQRLQRMGDVVDSVASASPKGVTTSEQHAGGSSIVVVSLKFFPISNWYNMHAPNQGCL